MEENKQGTGMHAFKKEKFGCEKDRTDTREIQK
jgi:hypothetical protein